MDSIKSTFHLKYKEEVISMNDPTINEEVVEDWDFSNEFTLVGLRVAYFRKQKKWTQEQLAVKLGMQTSTIGAIEAPNMIKKISLTTLFKIAKVLEVPPHKLLEF